MACCLLGLAGCAHDPIGSIATIYGYSQAESGDLPPIVIVAGFLGSVLEDRDSGRVVWGRFLAGEQRSFLPEVQRRLALPMTGGASLPALRDNVVPVRIMSNAQVKLGPIEVTANAYPGLLFGILSGIETRTGSSTPSTRELRKQARSREADESNVASLMPVAYDWRRDITEANSSNAWYPSSHRPAPIR